MLMQIIGALAVTGGAAALGFYYAKKQTERIQDLLEMKKALLILSSEIEYKRTPLPDAAANIGKRAARWVVTLFIRFGELLNGAKSESAFQLWRQALDEAKQDAALEAEDIQIIEDFGKTLGYLDKQMQQNAIAYTVGYIDEKNTALQVQADSNKKMYRSLGVIGGLLLAVILW
jgi:stage III sporulation protein AB